MSFGLSHLESAKRLDKEASDLLKEHSECLVAVLFDGVVVFSYRLQAPASGGVSEIAAGLGEKDARDLVAILTAGGIAAPLGRMDDNGQPEFREPVSITPYGAKQYRRVPQKLLIGDPPSWALTW